MCIFIQIEPWVIWLEMGSSKDICVIGKKKEIVGFPFRERGFYHKPNVALIIWHRFSLCVVTKNWIIKCRFNREYCSWLWYLPPVVKALRNILLCTEWTVDQVALLFFSPPFIILLNAHVPFWNSLVLTVVSFVFYLSNVYIFLRAYLIQEKPHRFVLASTAFIRAYKISSGKVLCRRTFLHIHTFQHMDIAFLAQCFSLLSVLVRC